MNAAKFDFLKNKFISLLQKIPSGTKPVWGKMTVQQMIEHFSDSVRVASGKTIVPIVTPQENLPKMNDFLLSEKPFKENTNNPLLPETPAPVKNSSIPKALEELQSELNYFFTVFEANKNLTTVNPFFGALDFDKNVQLLHKHAVHHLRQFSPLSPGGGT